MLKITLPTAYHHDIESDAVSEAVERVESATYQLAGWAERAFRSTDTPAELARQLGVLRDLLNASITDLITAE